MCLLFSFMPTMVFVVLGYFVLFSATKAEGATHKFGQVLTIWIFVIAAVIPIMGAAVDITMVDKPEIRIRALGVTTSMTSDFFEANRAGEELVAPTPATCRIKVT